MNPLIIQHYILVTLNQKTIFWWRHTCLKMLPLNSGGLKTPLMSNHQCKYFVMSIDFWHTLIWFWPTVRRLLFFRAETSWLFSFKPCAHFKTIFLKIGPGVMTRRCVIERWVQRKTDQKLIFNGNYTQIVFFVIFLFQDTLSLCFILFIWFIWSKNMCKHTLTHIIAKKCNFCLKK